MTPAKTTTTRPERFWSLVARDKVTGCWVWRGSRRNGYGTYAARYAHRVAWTLAHGAIPAGQQVLHRCDNPLCVWPEHLYLGTPADNHADKARRGRAARNGNRRRLTIGDVDEIRQLHKRGLSQKQIAKLFGIGQSTANQIITRRRWTTVA